MRFLVTATYHFIIEAESSQEAIQVVDDQGLVYYVRHPQTNESVAPVYDAETAPEKPPIVIDHEDPYGHL